MSSPELVFHEYRYLRTTMRRLEHLARLDLPIESRTVLEIGAGIGDFTSFFLDRGCVVTSTEPRAENVAAFRERAAPDPIWPAGQLRIVQSDAASLKANGISPHQVVVCYSVLNFTSDPQALLQCASDVCTELLLLECAALSGPHKNDDFIEPREADPNDICGSIEGRGCMPSRPWVFNRLKDLFAHVYMPLEQPAFERFKRDWTTEADDRGHHRAIFIASRAPLENPLLVEDIPQVHAR